MNLFLQLKRRKQDELVTAFWANETRPRTNGNVPLFGYETRSAPVKRYVAPPQGRSLVSQLLIPTQVTAVDSNRDPQGNSPTSEPPPTTTTAAPTTTAGPTTTTTPTTTNPTTTNDSTNLNPPRPGGSPTQYPVDWSPTVPDDQF